MNPQIFCKSLKLHSNLLASRWLSKNDLARGRTFELMSDISTFLQQESVTNLFQVVIKRMF